MDRKGECEDGSRMTWSAPAGRRGMRAPS